MKAIIADNDPLTYGVDGLRGTLIGISAFPLWLDFTVLLILCIVFSFSNIRLLLLLKDGS